MPYSPDTILTNLKNGEYSPFYFLQGEENYYIHKISEYIQENAIEESQKAFNLTVLYGADQSLIEIIGLARRYPVLAQRQVLIIKEAQDIKDMNREKGEELLIHYANNPVPSTILVFCYRGKKLDKRKSLYKNLDKH